MSEKQGIRISKVVKEFNIGIGTLTDFLKKKGIEVDASPNSKISEEAYALVEKEFNKELQLKEESKKIILKVKEATAEDQPVHEPAPEPAPVPTPKPAATSEPKPAPTPAPAPKPAPAPEPTPEPTPKPTPKPIPEPAPKPIQETIPEPAPKPTPEPAPKPTPEPVPAPAPTTAPAAVEPEIPEKNTEPTPEKGPTVVGKIDLDQFRKTKEKKAEVVEKRPEKEKPTPKAEPGRPKSAPEKKPAPAPQPKPAAPEHIETEFEKLAGPKITGQIDLSQFDRKKSTEDKDKSKPADKHKGKRERIQKPHRERVDVNKVTPKKADNGGRGKSRGKERFKPIHVEIDEDAIQKQIKETYARMTEGKGKTKGSKHRREKREIVSQRMAEEQERIEQESTVLRVTEFVTVNELATLMNVPVVKVIDACMNLGLMVSINQRLDAEAMELVAEEFGFKVEFVTADLQETIQEEEDDPADLSERPPIVTVMGHVDHGKTSLLDHIRDANVIAGEAGGITQHIGAYSVLLDNGRLITFLDTPGHEAFTAMRARGAKVTDMAIIIIAADDAIMPQTKEAINHASAAGVPMIFAINKIDKTGANPEKIREQLANMNILVEDWGGKYQCQEISAKQGTNVDKLLEKVLLEADLLELRANPNKRASGTIIESSLDKGRGYLATILVQNGTLHQGDVLLSGCCSGKVRAMYNERGQKITQAGPATPASVLGLNGAPPAGELFSVMEDEKEARELAGKREQLIRIQGLKTQKHITLEEIGRRIAVGNFQELNIIVKADVDGSIEALSDSLIKLSTEEVQVNVIHKAVGGISESDVLLATASNAIIIGFQVRPSASARKLAEKEEIEIRLYSVIYDAIDEVKQGIEGMLAPEEKEEITATVEVRETFKISKVGTIAGCMVKEGKITRNAKVRIIRDGIVVYTGTLGSLKRFKDDVKEVQSGYDCGLNIEGYNDIKVGDIVEAYTITEVKRKL
ncbi:MAG TPA: translation initiation factor IF-2 [Bacteroidales bacterium]|nr:translation initiation factor IF-2 [Bacteroidales bacterium]